MPIHLGEKVCVDPEDTMVRPMLVSGLVANVWVVLVSPFKDVMARPEEAAEVVPHTPEVTYNNPVQLAVVVPVPP